MPYIPQIQRDRLDPFLRALKNQLRNAPVGVVNYAITSLVLDQPHATYHELNAIVGVLECAKLELYRRLVAPYEDTKIAENGDVY